MQTPPPIPVRTRMAYGTKVLLLGLQCGMLMIGALVVWLMTESRYERSRDVTDQIVNDWGGPVIINGPAAIGHADSTSWIYPTIFNCEAKVDTKSLHRNIFEAEVFNAHVALSGTFNRNRNVTDNDSLYIELSVPATQLSKLSTLEIGGTTVEWNREEGHLFVEIDISEMPQVIQFSTAFDIRGAESLFVTQIGEHSFITIDGEARNPSFQGSKLPDERSLSGGSFSAKWETTGALTPAPDFKASDSVGAEFLVGVDRYQKVTRSLKYAFMIILLTYASVLFAEIVMKRYIPLLNYFLIGAALIIFYILLLSFSEHLRFGIAYLIAAAMTVSLIAGYMWRMLGSRKVGIAIGVILTGMYVSCYILLTLSTYSLLLGSLILFMALAAMMYGSLQIKR